MSFTIGNQPGSMIQRLEERTVEEMPKGRIRKITYLD